MFHLFISGWDIGVKTAGISMSLLKKTRAMIDANRVIRLYLKGVVDSQSIKVKSAALVTAWFIIARSRRTMLHAKRGGGAGVGRRRDRAPSFVLISPDVTCEAHFRNYPWKISMSRSIVIKWFKGRGLALFKWYSSSHVHRLKWWIVIQMSLAPKSYFSLSLFLATRVWESVLWSVISLFLWKNVGLICEFLLGKLINYKK